MLLKYRLVPKESIALKQGSRGNSVSCILGGMNEKTEAQIFHATPAPRVGHIVPNPIGSMNYNVLRVLLEDLNLLQLQKGAEIGTFEGATASYLLKRFPELKLFCVDPFKEYSEFESQMTQEKMSRTEFIARRALAPFGDRVEIIKNFSLNAAQLLPDESLDFVFIDAIHSYEAVLSDITAWYPKVRRGGLVSGHDYSWKGVAEAVTSFVQSIGIGGFHTPSTSDVWFLMK